MSESTTEIWLPYLRGAEAWQRSDQGLAQRITLNHELRAAVRGPFDVPWAPPSTIPLMAMTQPETADGTAVPIDEQPESFDLEITPLGERSLGPLLLVGNRQALGGGMSIEYWEVQAAGASQWPIVIEHTVSSGDGGSETMRVTTEVSRISVEQGFFDVPSSYFLHDLLER